MGPLQAVSVMAPNAHGSHEAIMRHLARTAGIRIDFVTAGSWQQRQCRLMSGQVQVGFICGLPYVQEADRLSPRVELLAAPVMQGIRYGGRPVYFSDVVVRRDGTFRSLADLEGATWAINEPNSQSGCNVVGHHLALQGLSWKHFGNVIRSGAHQASLSLILAGEIDGTAIDSTVLETEMLRRPALADHLRIVATLGPSPIPPVVVSSTLAPAVKSCLRDALTRLHDDAAGRATLDAARIDRFVPMGDSDYDPIRQMNQWVHPLAAAA